MKRVDTWKSVFLLLLTPQLLRLQGFVQAYRRMSIAVNGSTVNPHYWYRQPPSGLPSWYSRSSTTFRNHKVFQLRFLTQSDVRCNDGTRAGYYVRRSKDLKSRNWLIYLEGGWYCFDEATCISRQITNHALFSSRTWHMIRYIGGVLSWDDRINPNYHNYNTIFVPYCSSDLWTGKKRERTGGYYFHGSRILTAVIDDLLRQPEFTRVDKVVFSGSSLWQPRIPRRCRMAQGKKNFWQCYLGPVIYSHLRTPTFIIQSLFDEAQLQMSRAILLTGGSYNKLAYIQNLGKAVAKSLDTVQGVFAPACTDHEILTTNHWAQLMVDSQSLHDTLMAWDAHLTRWRRYPDWYFHLQSPRCPYRGETGHSRSPDYSLQGTHQPHQLNSSMIFLSKLVAVLNRPKTDKSAMRGGREHATRRSPRDLLRTHPPFRFRVVDRCSLDVGPDDEVVVVGESFSAAVSGNLAAACAGRSHMTPLCNPSCRTLTHPHTMERLSVVSLYELYGVDSAQLAANIGVSVTQLKALPVKMQMQMLFCLPV
ncbi:hypothetical protein EGR_08111 [Echinococcus granulosus]|uniref:Protein notum n=1 Tax=Echinococcus granulosus TaxID=6210 RepID=W6U781_ECHGR|nr:hypothetical protein EGR_08111 [Echinococcus granulosus]EUB57035.1 hypothetical protein EGR_08111 [Echinococcus granulosus]